jgi:hypothetical protein
MSWLVICGFVLHKRFPPACWYADAAALALQFCVASSDGDAAGWQRSELAWRAGFASLDPDTLRRRF